jgi:hypothetical protein
MSAPDIPLDDINLDLNAIVDGNLALNANLAGGATINANLGGATSVDVGLDTLAAALTTGVRASVAVGLDNIRLQELPPVRLQAALDLPLVRTDSKIDAGLDNIRIREFPLNIELAMKPARFHLPVNFRFCLRILGIRLVDFTIQGEGMAVVEGYKARATERCEA